MPGLVRLAFRDVVRIEVGGEDGPETRRAREREE